MKALEELLGEFCNGQPLEADVGLRLAAAIHEYNRECNEHLREVVTKALIKRITSEPDWLDGTVDAILAALPPQEDRSVDPVTLQTHMEKWQAEEIGRLRAENDELRKKAADWDALMETGKYPAELREPAEVTTIVDAIRIQEVTALLNELRPIRKEQEGRIERAIEAINKRLGVSKAIEILQEFLSEMQKAKSIHSKLDVLLAGVTPAASLKFNIGGNPVSTGISPVEAEEIDALLGRKKPNLKDDLKAYHKNPLSDKEVVESLIPPFDPVVVDKAFDEMMADEDTMTKAAIPVAGIGDPDDSPIELGETGKITDPLLGWANKRIEVLEEENTKLKDKAQAYDDLRKRCPFLPGDRCFVLGPHGIMEVIVDSIALEDIRFHYYLEPADSNPDKFYFVPIKGCYHTEEECRASIPVVRLEEEK